MGNHLINQPRVSLATGRRALNMTLRRAAQGFGKVRFQTLNEWEQGSGGFTDASRDLLGEYCDWLRGQAVARGIDPAVFERWVLCPIDFPAPGEREVA